MRGTGSVFRSRCFPEGSLPRVGARVSMHHRGEAGLGKFKDYYRVLGVPPRAHARVIEERYWEQAHELHGEPTRRAAKRLRLINEAYETLGSPHKRERYDQLRVEFIEPDCVDLRPGLLQTVVSLLGKPFRPD